MQPCLLNSGKPELVAHRASENIQSIQLCATALKKTKEIDDDPRQDLLHDVEGTVANQSLLRCPKLCILIEGIEIEALLDTGREITCISQEFYEKHSNIL